MLKVYAASVVAGIKIPGGMETHNKVILFNAKSDAETKRRAMDECKRMFPPGRGFSGHGVSTICVTDQLM